MSDPTKKTYHCSHKAHRSSPCQTMRPPNKRTGPQQPNPYPHIWSRKRPKPILHPTYTSPTHDRTTAICYRFIITTKAHQIMSPQPAPLINQNLSTRGPFHCHRWTTHFCTGSTLLPSPLSLLITATRSPPESCLDHHRQALTQLQLEPLAPLSQLMWDFEIWFPCDVMSYIT